MGSITSRPKVPTTQTKVVYVPTVYTSSASSSNTTSTTSATDATSAETSDAESVSEAQSKARTESLLKRDRSRFGTVLTGFRGLLASASGNAPQRKTLLGE